jgi:hypothetical protein
MPRNRSKAGERKRALDTDAMSITASTSRLWNPRIDDLGCARHQ